MISVHNCKRCLEGKPFSRNSKHYRWESSKVLNKFENVDRRALKVASFEHATFEELIWDLLFQWNYDDLKRARAVFLWIATKNFQTIAFGKASLGSEEEAIHLFRDGKIDHAELYCRLTRRVGLCCVVIEGLTKGNSYKVGGTGLNLHRWNAVRIDDYWRLVDICWAKGHMKDKCSQYFDSTYFCSDPNHLIYTHFPNDPKWQLLDRPITEKLFLSFPLLRAHFFQSGLSLVEFSGVLETYNGSVSIPLGHSHYLNGRCLGDHFESTFFSFALTEMSGRSICGYVLQETKRNEEIFYIRCPHIGTYYFTIYYSLPSLSKAIPVNKPHCFKPVCQYKIICHSNPKPNPFPSSKAPIGWGSHLLPLKRFQIVPNHASAILVTKRRKLDLFFRKLKPEVRLFAVLSANGRTSRELDQYVHIVEQRIHRNATQSSSRAQPSKIQPRTLVSITLPRPGEYCLEIYANDPYVDGNIFVLICRHLIVNLNPGGSHGNFRFENSIDGGTGFQKLEIEVNHPGNVLDYKRKPFSLNRDCEQTSLSQGILCPLYQRSNEEDRPQIIFTEMKEFNRGQEVDWKEFKPRRCYSFRCYSEPRSAISSPSHKGELQAGIDDDDHGMILTRDDHVLHEERPDWNGLEMRSDIVYQSRLKLRMAKPEPPDYPKKRRNIILLSSRDFSKGDQKTAKEIRM